jgi:hypothetical protein
MSHGPDVSYKACMSGQAATRSVQITACSPPAVYFYLHEFSTTQALRALFDHPAQAGHTLPRSLCIAFFKAAGGPCALVPLAHSKAAAAPAATLHTSSCTHLYWQDAHKNKHVCD